MELKNRGKSAKKPLMWSFLKLMFDGLKELENGVMVEDYQGRIVRCQATLITCICELPAKCLVSNSIQFNGKYGCWYCLQPGKTFHTDKGGHCHVFPYQNYNPTGPSRTRSSVEEDVTETVIKIQACSESYVTSSRGVKGLSWFMFLRGFNVIDGYNIDYMHGLCAGMMKTLLMFWFAKEHKKKNFSCFDKRDYVNKELSKIKPTIFVTRITRSLDELVYW